jgi:hypothetical protein
MKRVASRNDGQLTRRMLAAVQMEEQWELIGGVDSDYFEALPEVARRLTADRRRLGLLAQVLCERVDNAKGEALAFRAVHCHAPKRGEIIDSPFFYIDDATFTALFCMSDDQVSQAIGDIERVSRDGPRDQGHWDGGDTAALIRGDVSWRQDNELAMGLNALIIERVADILSRETGDSLRWRRDDVDH